MNENLQNTTVSTGNSTPQPTVTETSFLHGTETADKEVLYADLFQQNDGSEWTKRQENKKSALKILTTVLTFVTPIVVVIAILAGGYAYVRSQETNSMAENFPFLCGILTTGINTEDPNHHCQTPLFIQSDQEQKAAMLEKNIVEQLSVYIPLKLSAAVAASSPEKKFATTTYDKKVNANDIISQFEKIRKAAQSPTIGNIVCTQMNISNATSLTVQCDVYGGDIGEIDTRSLGSARIEAIRFIERLSDTQSSQFLVETPPTTLSVSAITDNEKLPAYIKTKTTLTLTMKYFPTTSKL